MRNKPRKIKRYSKIYRRRSNVRSKILKTAGFVVIVAAVVFVGYSVAGPFMDFINGRIEPSSSNDSSSIVSVDTDSSSADPSVKNNTLQAVALSLETAKDPTALSAFLTSAKSDGANAVVLELKDTAGTLWYRSSVAQAEEYGAVSENAVEITQIVETIKAQGLRRLQSLVHLWTKPLRVLPETMDIFTETARLPGGIMLLIRAESRG